MTGDDIYRKTEKGRTEIATRANKLGLRDRTMLILVDDKTSHSGLLSRNNHPTSADIIDALLAQGFIEIAPATAPASAAAPVQTATRAPTEDDEKFLRELLKTDPSV